MGSGRSGLYSGTHGSNEAVAELLYALGEDVIIRIMPNGDRNIDFNQLPGSKGYQVAHRLSDRQMEFLTNEYGVEFAQVYQQGPGKNGGGGKYFIYSGSVNSVFVPINKDTMLINHTHPGGTAWPSKEDMKLMALSAQLGSPQRTSSIIPAGKKAIYFTSKGKKR